MQQPTPPTLEATLSQARSLSECSACSGLGATASVPKCLACQGVGGPERPVFLAARVLAAAVRARVGKNPDDWPLDTLLQHIEVARACPACKGSGRENETAATCPSCHGGGSFYQVPVAHMKRLVRALECNQPPVVDLTTPSDAVVDIDGRVIPLTLATLIATVEGTAVCARCEGRGVRQIKQKNLPHLAFTLCVACGGCGGSTVVTLRQARFLVLTAQRRRGKRLNPDVAELAQRINERNVCPECNGFGSKDKGTTCTACAGTGALEQMVPLRYAQRLVEEIKSAPAAVAAPAAQDAGLSFPQVMEALKAGRRVRRPEPFRKVVLGPDDEGTYDYLYIHEGHLHATVPYPPPLRGIRVIPTGLEWPDLIATDWEVLPEPGDAAGKAR